MIKPHWCLLNVFITFLISIVVFNHYENSIFEYFFITIYILIALYTIHAVVNDHEKYLVRSWKQIIPKAFGKYIFWGVLIYGASSLYENHTFYVDAFPHVGRFFKTFLKIYCFVGFPYHVFSEKLRYSWSNFFADPYIRILSLFRLLKSGQWTRARGRLFRGEYRRFFLSNFLRFHFIAIMVEGVYVVHASLLNEIKGLSSGISFAGIVATLTALAWSIDNNNAAMGYFWESNFTKTRFRAMDPFPIHWIVTLICYHPFNQFSGNFLAYPFKTETGLLLIDGAWFKTLTDCMLCFFITGYALSGTTTAFSWSNLSYKQIQTRGPYAFIRHPGTFFKLGIFGTMIFREYENWCLYSLFGYMIWCAVYFSRTVCEERFLRLRPEYAEYMKKTKFRVIPWVY